MDKPSILVQFGLKVKEERLKRKWSQEKLAERAYLHITYIGMVEIAEKNITLTNIEKITLAWWCYRMYVKENFLLDISKSY